MMILLNGVLAPADLERLRETLAEAQWRDGRATAGPMARRVKDNLQGDGADPAIQAAERFVLEALRRNGLFKLAAKPLRLSRLLFSRTGPGQGYGRHTDDAMMGAGDQRLRADLAFTLFLSPPDSYAGGALVIEGPGGEQAIKLAAGDMVVYPATTIHRVETVREGERWVAVGWAQSLVRDPAKREVLFDLAQVREGLPEDDPRLLLIDKTVSNLLRMWAEP